MKLLKKISRIIKPKTKSNDENKDETESKNVEINHNEVNSKANDRSLVKEIVQPLDYGTEYEINKKISNLNIELEKQRVKANELLDELGKTKNLYANIKKNANNMFNSLLLDTNGEVIYEEKGKANILAFDLENNIYFDGILHRMPDTFKHKNDIIDICKDKAIYLKENIYTSSKLCFATEEEINKNADYTNSLIISLADVMGKYNFKDDYSIYCMAPESIDIFNSNIRKCLTVSGKRILSIPKSIAIVHSLLSSLNEDDRLIVIDLDSKEPIYTYLQIGIEDNCKIIKRLGFGRENIRSLNNKLIEEYIKEYQKKYSVSFDENDRDYLINNKALINVLYNKNTIKIFNTNGLIKIIYDEDLFRKSIENIVDYFNSLVSFIKKKSTFKIIISSMFNYSIPRTLNCSFKNYFDGLSIIQKLLKENPNAVIWKEMLPKLQLEVIDNETHRFKHVNLIDSEAGNNIRFNMSENAPIEVALITLNKGKKDYYLPLDRELIFDDINGEKEAHFTDKSFPLENDIQVKLYVKFDYFSETPLTLIVKPVDSISLFKEIKNEWIPPHKIEAYKGKTYESHGAVIPSEIDRYTIKQANNSLKRFLSANGNIDFSERKFKYRLGIKFHYDLVMLWKNYKYIRQLFDIDNIDSNKLIGICESMEFRDLFANGLAILSNPRYNIDYKETIEYTLVDMVVIGNLILPSNKNILGVYQILYRKNKIMSLGRLSRCIYSNSIDKFKIYDKISQKICNENTTSGLVAYMRNLSQNCWFTKNWISLLYNSVCGVKACDHLLNAIYDYLNNKIFRDDKEFRDVMEFFVCLTRVREINPNFLDPNNEFTKNLLKLIKEDYEIVKDTLDEDKLVSRLTISTDQGDLSGYPNYIYMLIMILSGEGQVNLVGYTDD